MQTNTLKLGVNVDHVATLRQARGGVEPDVVNAALIAVDAGADSITVHLREDRRHIQDEDVYRLKKETAVILNLEMAATDEMIAIAEKVQPDYCCIVPEKRMELTTEGGLDVKAMMPRLDDLCSRLHQHSTLVSLFIDADKEQVEASKECGADMIEIHTGHYANNTNKDKELESITNSAIYAEQIGLQVNAGHGLTIQNVVPIVKIPQMVELNIGHSIVSRAVFLGLRAAVREMKDVMEAARK